jgi:hypothetical protein
LVVSERRGAAALRPPRLCAVVGAIGGIGLPLMMCMSPIAFPTVLGSAWCEPCCICALVCACCCLTLSTCTVVANRAVSPSPLFDQLLPRDLVALPRAGPLTRPWFLFKVFGLLSLGFPRGATGLHARPRRGGVGDVRARLRPVAVASSLGVLTVPSIAIVCVR